ncbi:MAG TPA: response regulator [Pyrinomonadaceae bacterium]|jgi:two-component system sensor histidine kinase RpfC|nr:response regulator [Pyrinomonadaceae bacterium]
MSPLSRTRILITEDDLDTRTLLEFLLDGAGHEVTSTSSLEEALTAAKVGGFDLYLLDNWLAASSGIELCEKLREFDLLTPILFCSGAAYEKDKENALRAGAQGYLVKPVDAEVLIAEISRLIAKSRVVN